MAAQQLSFTSSQQMKSDANKMTCFWHLSNPKAIVCFPEDYDENVWHVFSEISNGMFDPKPLTFKKDRPILRKYDWKTRGIHVFFQNRYMLTIALYEKNNYLGEGSNFCFIFLVPNFRFICCGFKPPAKEKHIFLFWPVDSFTLSMWNSQTWRGLDVPGLLKWVGFSPLKFKVWGSNRCICVYI